MTREPPERARRWTLRLLLLALALPSAGCSFFEDEFTWLDRRAPAAVPAPPPSGTEAGQ